MGYMIRQITTERTLCQELTVDLLQSTLTNATIETVLTAHDAHAARARKFTMTAVVWILIAMNLYTTIAISAVIRTVFKSLRLLSPAADPSFRAIAPSPIGAINWAPAPSSTSFTPSAFP